MRGIVMQKELSSHFRHQMRFSEHDKECSAKMYLREKVSAILISSMPTRRQL